MIIKSFIKSDFGLRPVSIEVVLVPGLSQIQILGLADQVIKESSKRILSALRHQDFRMPPGKQALVNLYPVDLRKTGPGLDLPIALGVLLESQQIEMDDFNFTRDYCYGSLSLKGEILCPRDLSLLNYELFEKKVITGPSENKWRFTVEELQSLSEVGERVIKEPSPEEFSYQEPEIKSPLLFNQKMSRLMSIVAHGEHPLLLAGYAGSGKTTLVESLVKLLNPPTEKLFLEARKYWKLSGRDLTSRPLVQPHHSATPSSMIGGGRPLKFGEVSLAHGGAMILDELLEFHSHVQSALREPMEKGVIHLSRVGGRQTFPADTLVLATTNLCPCGNFQPGHIYDCRCSSLRLRNYVERLTGPFLDRFAIFHIVGKTNEGAQFSLEDIKKELVRALEFQKQRRDQQIVNQKLGVSDLMGQLDPEVSHELIPYSKSHRRRQSLLRVARTLADLEESEKIKQNHLEEAQEWTQRDIYKMEQFRMEDFR